MGMDCLGALCDKLCINSCVDAYEAGNGYTIQFHKVKLILGIWM